MPDTIRPETVANARLLHSRFVAGAVGVLLLLLRVVGVAGGIAALLACAARGTWHVACLPVGAVHA